MIRSAFACLGFALVAYAARASAVQESVSAPVADPTRTDAALGSALDDGDRPRPSDERIGGVTPEPTIALRGLAQAVGRAPVALLSVDERLVRVASGTTLEITPLESARVVEIARGEVVIEFGRGADVRRQVLR